MRLGIVICLVLTLPVVSALLSEERYGEDLSEKYLRKEIAWVRSNHDIVFDVADQQNKRVRSMTDEEVAALLSHPTSRERIGVDQANITVDTGDEGSEESVLFCFHDRAFGEFVTRAHVVPSRVRFFTALWCRSAVV